MPGLTDQAFKALEDSGAVAPPPEFGPDAGSDQWLPFMEHQGTDPSLRNYAPTTPYGIDTDKMESEYPDKPVGHLPPTQPTAQYDAAGVQQHGRILPPGAVTVTGGQRPPTKAEIRQQQLDDPTAPLAPDDMAGANYRESAALDAEHASADRAATAKIASERDLATRKAEALERSAAETQQADAAFQKERIGAHAQADAETATWLREYTDKATKEPNPHRWWDNQSGFGKAMWLIGLLGSSTHAAITPGAKNVALEAIQQEIGQDVQLQKERLNRELTALKMKGEVMDKRHLRNITDLTDDHTMTLGRLAALKQAYLERAAVPGAAQDAEATTQVGAWFDQQMLGVASKRADRARETYEADANRRNQYSLAMITDNRDRAIAAAHNATQLALAKLSAGASEAAAQAALDKDTRGVSRDTGLFLGNSATGTSVNGGIIRTHKEDQNHEKMAALGSMANQRYHDLKLVAEHLGDDSLFTMGAKLDPAMQAAILRLGYSSAKENDPGGHLTDMDLAKGIEQNFGVNPSGGWVDAGRVAASRGKILAQIQTEMEALPKRVSNAASQYNDTKLNGENSRIYWTPQDLDPPKAPSPTASDDLKAGGYQVPTVVPKDQEELRKAQAMEASDPRFAGKVVQYDRGKVKVAEASFEGRSPDTIDKMAKRALDPFDKGYGLDPTTKMAIETARDDAKTKAEQTLLDVVKYAEFRELTGRKLDRAEVVDLAKRKGLTDLLPAEIDDIITAAKAKAKEDTK